MNEFKPLNEWDRDTTTQYIIELQKRYGKGSVESIKGIIKKFFNWAGKPEVVEHIKINMPKGTLRREDILTPEDVNKMIEATKSPMYQALISFLFDSGARINEVLPILVDDTEETDKGLIVTMKITKTGEDFRRVLCVFSGQYIRNLISYNGLGKGDRLFDINDTSAWTMLKKIGQKAGIDKPISPHKFRHARATDLVLRGYQEDVIRKKLGWTDNSSMISRYQNLVDEDVINSDLEKSGAIVAKTPISNIKQPEALKMADANLQLGKLAEENAQLKAEMEDFKKTLREDFAKTLKLLNIAEFASIAVDNLKVVKKARRQIEKSASQEE